MKEDKKVVKKTTTKKPTKKKPVKKIAKETKVEKPIKEEVIVKDEIKKVEVKKTKIDPLKVLLIFTMITAFVALLIAKYYASTSHFYTFSGFNDKLIVDSGLIATRYNGRAFEGNNFTYVGEDKKVTSYILGYYVISNNLPTPIITASRVLDEPESLKSITDSIVGFGFDEFKGIESARLDNEVLDLINQNKLYFLISYNTEVNGELVTEAIELKLNVSKK